MADDAKGGGFGQQDPSDSASEHNADVFLVEQIIATLSTAKVVEVMAVDADAQTVDVKPLVKQINGANNTTPHGTINGVPFLRLQGGKNAVIIDPVVGDKGLMAVCDRDISAVKSTKAEAPPGSLRQYDAADGIYVGGLLNGAPDQWVKFLADGVQVHDKNSNDITTAPGGITLTDANGCVLETKAAGFFFNKPVFVDGGFNLSGSIKALDGTSTYGGNIHTTATITGDTDVIANGKSGAHHVHGGVVTGGAVTDPPT